MSGISFVVHGTPVSQGSKDPWGGETNAKKLRPWRAAVAAEAAAQMNGEPPITGPVLLRVAFYFARPKSHFGTGRNANVLKQNAPHYVAKAPDLDKLIRSIGDALTSVAIRDDAQIASISAVKLWSPAARCEIMVEELASPLKEE